MSLISNLSKEEHHIDLPKAEEKEQTSVCSTNPKLSEVFSFLEYLYAAVDTICNFTFEYEYAFALEEPIFKNKLNLRAEHIKKEPTWKLISGRFNELALIKRQGMFKGSAPFNIEVRSINLYINKGVLTKSNSLKNPIGIKVFRIFNTTLDIKHFLTRVAERDYIILDKNGFRIMDSGKKLIELPLKEMLSLKNGSLL